MQLNIKQRFAVLIFYLSLIIGLGWYFTNSWKFVINTNDPLNSLLIVTALALILGVFITEPHFTKPVDVFTRWVAILLFLIGLNNRDCLSLYNYWIIISVLFISFSLLLILLNGISRIEIYQRIAVDFICKISRPEIVFSVLYFDLVISFFRYYTLEYPILIGFGFLLAINKPIIWLVKYLSTLLSYFSVKADPGVLLGQIIGHDSIDLFSIELDNNNPIMQKALAGSLVYLENRANGIVGIVLSERILLGKKWLQILALRDENNVLISFDLKSRKPLSDEKSIFSKTNAVYLLELKSINEELADKIQSNPIYSNFSNLIGCVWEGSTINRIRFNKLFTDRLQTTKNIGEGTIIETIISGRKVLYQIIDGKTIEENLEYKDGHGYTIGVAQKLGEYIIARRELNSVKWLPEIYTPIFLLDTDANGVVYSANANIGKLPNTNYGIPILKPNELVTHNTAILGILGIGKSCLTFELLKKALETTPVKVICIDLTKQYSRELPNYIQNDLIQNDLRAEVRAEIAASIRVGQPRMAGTWGNETAYKDIFQREFGLFVNSDKRVLVVNPDIHKVQKANDQYNPSDNESLTAAQKARIISEQVFINAQALQETSDARYLIVFEEAHSLIPEWNSVSNEGDKSAANGTAKVILQGRKYGLGSFIVTQRTANISKSVLNQCNTIFALRVFDDTGKQFLENYIGSDYSNLLPTLEERHCIAIGKALSLKQPIVIELNDSSEIILPPV